MGQVEAVRMPAGAGQVRDLIVNDFAFTVASPNGTGSQTSNLVLLRTLFNMGIPVTGKNLFPSNIQGLPTWFTIRLSHKGYLARKDVTEILVCPPIKLTVCWPIRLTIANESDCQ